MRISKLLKNIKVIKSEKQPKNLGDILQHSYFGSKMFDHGSKKCGAIPCVTCNYIEEGVTAYFPNVGMHYKIRHKFNCNSGYLIYKIRCKGCNGYYIGRTTCLRDRLTSHKCQVTNKDFRHQHLHNHIYSCAGYMAVPFTIMPFYKVKKGIFKRDANS